MLCTRLKCERYGGKTGPWNIHGVICRGRVALCFNSPAGNELVRSTQLYENHVCGDINQTF